MTVATEPYEDTGLAKYLKLRALELRPKKTLADIAAEACFVDTNAITMLKTGASKVPLDRLPTLAAALDCDPAWLLRLGSRTDGRGYRSVRHR